MSFLRFLRKKKDYALENPEIQAEAYARSIETRQNEAEIRKLQHRYKALAQERRIAELQADIGELKGLFSGEEEETKGGVEDKLLAVLLSKILTPQNQQPGFINSESHSQTFTEARNLSDDEIRKQLKDIPKKYRNLAKNLSDDVLIGYIKKSGAYDDKTITRALQIFRNEKI